MKSYRKELWFNIPTRRASINITAQVEECLEESKIREGLILVNAMHITASVFINDDELHEDYDEWLEKLWPPMSLLPSTATTGLGRITGMPTSSGRSWDGKSW